MSTSHKNALLMDYLRCREARSAAVQPCQRKPAPRPMSMVQWFGIPGLLCPKAQQGGVQ